MIKHRWRELAKSFGNYLDPEKTEQLKRTKTDIENNVTRIFKLIKNEEMAKKDGNRKDSKNESELVGLIENFYQQYQSLYTLYDHLIGESGRIVRSRKGSPFSPSSSGSDTEYFSSDETENNNINSEYEHHKMVDSPKQNGLKICDYFRSSEEKEAINAEYMAAVSKIKEAETANEADERVKELSALVEAHELHGTQSSARVKELEGQLSGFKTDLECLCSQKRDLEAWKECKCAEVKQLGDKNIGLHARILELEFVLKDKSDEISDLRKKHEENENSSTSKVAYLMAQTSNLQMEMESLRAQKGELEERMVREKNESGAQVKGLTDKIDAMKKELESLRWKKSDSAVQLDKKNKEISQHQRQIETLKDEVKRKDAVEKKMLEERHCFLKQVKDKELEVDSLRSQKKNLEKQKRNKIHETDRLRRERECLHAKIHELEKTITRREEVSALPKETGNGENEASAQLLALTTEVSNLKQELDSLQSQKSQLEMQFETENKKCLKIITEMENENKKMLQERKCFLDQVKDMECELQSLNNLKANLENQTVSVTRDTDKLRQENEDLRDRIFELDKALTERGDEAGALGKEGKDGNDEADMSLTKQVSNLKQELDTLQIKKSQLELQIERENKEHLQRLTDMEGKISNQQIVIQEQEDTIKNASKDHKTAKLQFPQSKLNLQLAERKMEELAEKHRVNFEYNVRILYQRIRVAEQIHNETRESYRKLKEEYDKETRDLKERLAFYENPVIKMKDISETAKRTLNRLDGVTRRFEEEHEKSINKISIMSNDVQVAKSWVATTSNEIKRLKHHADCAKLDEKDEHESLLKEKVWKLEAAASKEAGEKLNLMKNMSQLEKQVGKLERTIKEKDEDLLSLGEEKREVIRQLCVLIDYHRSRFDDLKETMSKRLARSITAT